KPKGFGVPQLTLWTPIKLADGVFKNMLWSHYLCIPIDNRPVHTFVEATEQQLKTICGRQNNKVDCMSQDYFTVYDIQRRKDGHYTNVGKVTRRARIVVTCENNSPIHFVCTG
uniref:Uncharacterized protein n=1 Tax=Erpetoichthys calabaricus TaxID=27687 RepID=A0A8C4RI00_ERPCA